MGDKPTREEIEWLTEVKNARLLGRGSTKQLPDAMRDRLIVLGLVEQKLGGLVVTPEGEKALRK
jgi:hypothetical protein